MADPDVVYELADRIHSNADNEKKIAAFHALQDHIEAAGHVVEADAVTSAIKNSLRSSNQLLSSTALTFLCTYIPLLYPATTDASFQRDTPAEHHHNVRLLVVSVAPIVLEKLGDQKERIREAARNALVDLGRAAYGVSSAQVSSGGKGKEVESPLGIFERLLREGGLAAKFARIREQAVLVLGPIRELCEKYPVRPLLSTMVDLLADADPSVREASRTTLVALFVHASPAAKSDLKNELERKGARKQTVEAILKEVLAGSSAGAESQTTASALPTSTGFMPIDRSAAAHSGPSSLGASRGANGGSAANGLSPSATYTKGAIPGSDDVKAVYIASRSDLERTFQAFLPFFDGKETEHNWLNREQSMVKIRGMLKAEVHRQFGEAHFVSCLRLVQEGVLKSLASLRTTLSMHAICLLSELAHELGDELSPCVEGFLSALIRMAGFTKKIVANATQEAAAAIMVQVSFRQLYLQLIWQGLQELNVATRVFSAEHLAIVLGAHASHRKHSMESHGGLELMDKCLKRGLADKNPEVRSKSRDALWKFLEVWPTEGRAMLNALDATTKKQVMTKAPPGMSLEAAVEAKPKVSGIPTRKPGGPSSAILAAKRAASAKVAQEKERQLAAEAAAAHEARLAAAVASANPASTSTTAASPCDGTPRARRTVSGASHSRLGSRQAPSMSPGSGIRNEAVMVPLPTSPPASSALGTPRPRTISLVSQPSSSGSNSGPRSPTTTFQHSPRTGASLDTLRQRAISSSSSSSIPSQMAMSSSSTGSGHRQPMLSHDDEDDEDEDLDDGGDVTQRMPGEGLGGDDTMQLPAPADVSVDLMNFNSPFRLPNRNGAGRPGRIDDHTAIGDDSMAFMETPMAQPKQRFVAAGPPMQAAVPRSPSVTSSPSTPGTIQKRSGLPRPASMFHRGPSPLSSRKESGDQPSSSESGSVDSASRHRPSKSFDAEKSSPSTAAAAATPTPIAAEASPSSKENRPFDALTATTKGNGSSGTTETRPHKWFLSRALRLENGASCSPAKAKPESVEWIAALANGQADRRTFQRLLKLSSDFKVPPRGSATSNATDGQSMLRPGRTGAAGSSASTRQGALGLEKMGESEDGDGVLISDAGSTDTDLAVELWQDNQLFTRLVAALFAFVLSTPAQELQTAGLVVLHKLIENQHPLFVACSKEAELLDLCFTLRQRNRASSWKGMAACQANLDAWAARTDPILGFSATVSCLSHLASPPSEGVYILALSTLNALAHRLPSELIEDLLPTIAPLLHTAIHHHDPAVRQAGVELLTTANAQMGGRYHIIFETLQRAGGEVEREKMDLLVYYFHKSASGAKSEG